MILYFLIYFVYSSASQSLKCQSSILFPFLNWTLKNWIKYYELDDSSNDEDCSETEDNLEVEEMFDTDDSVSDPSYQYNKDVDDDGDHDFLEVRRKRKKTWKSNNEPQNMDIPTVVTSNECQKSNPQSVNTPGTSGIQCHQSEE